MDIQKSRLLRFVFWFFFANSLIFWLIGSGYLSSILFSATLFKNFIADYSNWAGKIFILLFTFANYCSFMMLLAFIPALLVFSLVLVAPYQRLVMFFSVGLATLNSMLLIVDSQIYSMFKFHLNKTLMTLIFSKQWRAVFDFSQHEIVLAVGWVILIIGVECLLVWFVWSLIVVKGRYRWEKTIVVGWFGCVLFCYFSLMHSLVQKNNLLIQQASNIPLFNQFVAYTIPGANALDDLLRYSEQHYTEALYSHEALNYPRHPMRCSGPSSKPYNIILIMVDSLRFDSLRYMPNTMQFAAQNWQFLRHYSGGNSTQSGLFSLFYSIPSSYWTAALEQKKKSVLIQLLNTYHYTMQVIWSSEMHNPPLDKGIYRGVDNLSADGAPGDDVAEWDRTTTKKTIQFLTDLPSKKPFFLNIFYNAPHAFCRVQQLPALYQPIAARCSRMGMSNQTDPGPLYNNYLNAVAFIDSELEQVFKVIKERGYLENSVIIFTSDHGQEFNDNHQNYWGHAGNYTSVQVQVPLIIHWPKHAAQEWDYVTSAYDIVPTLLQRLFFCHNPLLDYSIGNDLLQSGQRLPFILAGSYVNMGIIEPDRLTTLQASGQINITDLNATPIPNAKPRLRIIHEVLNLMRLYYSRHPERKRRALDDVGI